MNNCNRCPVGHVTEQDNGDFLCDFCGSVNGGPVDPAVIYANVGAVHVSRYGRAGGVITLKIALLNSKEAESKRRGQHRHGHPLPKDATGYLEIYKGGIGPVGRIFIDDARYSSLRDDCPNDADFRITEVYDFRGAVLASAEKAVADYLSERSRPRAETFAFVKKTMELWSMMPLFNEIRYGSSSVRMTFEDHAIILSSAPANQRVVINVSHEKKVGDEWKPVEAVPDDEHRRLNERKDRVEADIACVAYRFREDDAQPGWSPAHFIYKKEKEEE